MPRDHLGAGGAHCINLGLGGARDVGGTSLALGDLSISLRTQKSTYIHYIVCIYIVHIYVYFSILKIYYTHTHTHTHTVCAQN